MGLFGALSSGVSGLTAQSSAMGAIADNITNVNTVGYKGTQVNFQTLVTRQTSSTFFSAGGVQSRPRTDAGIQGLLQSSTSQTDLGISGSGFFVVNEASRPTISNEFLFTRAGQFFQDNEGFLRNTAGFFLQGFPVNPQGEIIPNNPDILVPNVNVISTDFLTTINLSRVGGTASSTTNIAIGANFPANATTGQTHRTDVQFFDTLGNANNISLEYSRSNRDNQWDINVDPPQGTTDLRILDSNGNTSVSVGQLEFTARPADGSTVVIDNITYEFDRNTFGTTTASFGDYQAAVGGAIAFVDGGAGADSITGPAGAFAGLNDGDQIVITGANTGANNQTLTIVTANATTLTFATGSLTADAADATAVLTRTPAGNDFVVEVPNASTNNRITGDPGTFTGLAAGDLVTITNSENAGNNVATVRIEAVDTTSGAWIEFLPADTGTFVARPTGNADGTMTVTLFNGGAGETINTSSTPTVRVDVSSNTTVAQDVNSLLTRILAVDPNFDTTNNRVIRSPASATTLLFREDGTGGLTQAGATGTGITIDPRGLLQTDGTTATRQETNFTVTKRQGTTSEITKLRFTGVPANGDVITINGTNYTFQSGETADSNGGDTTISTAAGTIAGMLSDLEAAIENQDSQFAIGATTARVTTTKDGATNIGSLTNNTLELSALASGSYTVGFSLNFTGLPVEPDGTATFVADPASATAINKTNAIIFDSDGLPSAINVNNLEINNFSNGAGNFDSDPANAPRVTLDFGTIGVADGLTQFGSEFTPVFIQQDGSQFGTFAGVTVGDDGLMTALFDNGETRPVFKLPIATFVNVNELGSRTGNVFNATQASGDPTLRTANSGPAGAITQSSLEQSTVDIGEEFTKMIVVQRAFSAATKIITTADEMLDELVRLR